jgi:quercetin dioxygenase-like cupin family protein
MVLLRIYTGTVPPLALRERVGRICRGLFLVLTCTLACSVAAGGAAPSDAIVRQLLTRDLIGMPGKEVTMETVVYAPGGKSPPHRHNAQVFVFGLEGSVRMQVQGSPVVLLVPGGTFYEGPDDVHVLSENASQTAPAKFLVVMVKDKATGTTGRTDRSGGAPAQAAGHESKGN